jgi:hypothetical protein
VLRSSETCLITVELISCEMGLVRFLSTVPGDHFLLDQIVFLIAEIRGSTVATFCELPVAEKQESILQYFLINSSYIRKELSVEYHFSNELQSMLSSVFSPESKNIASSLADNDNLAFSTVDTECLFAMETETVPQKSAKECTQQPEVSKNAKASFAVPMDDSRPPATTVQKSTSRGGRRKVNDAPHSTRKVPAALEAHKGWSIIGTAFLAESEFSTKSDLLDNLLSA